MKTLYECAGCGNCTPHRHLHDLAHGIHGTHMAGSERFQCIECSHNVLHHDHNAANFPFIFDVPPQTTQVS